MKKIFQYIILLSVGAWMGCVEEIDKTFDEKNLVEFQATVTTTPAVGKTFPLINLINRDSVVNVQVNLIGRQRTAETTITISIDAAETTAAENTNYKLPNGGKVVFPANTSISTFQFQTIRAPAQAGKRANIVFVLEQSGDVVPSENFKKVGYSIAL